MISVRGLHAAMLAALLCSACGSAPAGEPQTATTTELAPAPAQAEQPVQAGVAAGAAMLEVHEWGVIDVPTTGALEVAAGPGRPAPEAPRPMRKPVLYFHLDPGVPPLDVEVLARIPGGSLLEAWPAGQLAADSIAWSRVRVASCPDPAPSITAQLPQLRGERWATRDGYNEVLELPDYETSDASCLSSGGTMGRLLFYRGAIPARTLPIEVARDAAGHQVMRASVQGAGQVIYTAGGRGIPLPWPAVGSEVGLPEAFTESFEGAHLARSLEREITARGLTEPEAGAFMRAWSVPFFGVATAPHAASRDLQEAGRESTRRGPSLGPPRAIVYVMPDATVPGVAELTITPTPRTVRRVMVVRIELGAR